MMHSKKYKLATFFFSQLTLAVLITPSCMRYNRISNESEQNIRALNKIKKIYFPLLLVGPFLPKKFMNSLMFVVKRFNRRSLLSCPICALNWSNFSFSFKNSKVLRNLLTDPIRRINWISKIKLCLRIKFLLKLC